MKLTQYQKQLQRELIQKEQRTLEGETSVETNNMTDDIQNISGQIQSWEAKQGKGTQGNWYQAKAKINGKTYGFFGTGKTNAEKLADQQKMLEIPVGTTVEFDAKQNGQYFNPVQGTLKILEGPSADLDVDFSDAGLANKPKPQQFTSDNYWRNKDKREVDNEAAYAYMRCLDSAAQALKVENHADGLNIIKLADIFFARVNEVKKKAIEAAKIEKETQQ